MYDLKLNKQAFCWCTVWLVRRGPYLVEIQLLEMWNLQIIETLRKSPVKLCMYVQDCAASIHKNIFLIMFTVGNVHNIFMEHDLHLIS